MPVAAVPSYLGDDFSEASPGMRFGMYLKLWGINQRTKGLLWTTHDIRHEVRGSNRQEREVKDENKVSALADAKKLNNNDQRIMHALAARQQHTFDRSVPADVSMQIEATAIAPFTTGLGNEHPLENGFAFLNPYGLPYLPGSGVKGVVRQTATELARGNWGETLGWSDDRRYVLQVGTETISLSMLDVFFGLQSGDGDTGHARGVLSFWDVVPRIDGDSLMVEIMTPHQPHYYQNGESPHESGKPNPITFLTVPPDSRFTFHVTCDSGRLNRVAPELAKGWQELLRKTFEHAFTWLGFGAKTAVGYGAMQRDTNAEQERQAHLEKIEESKARERELQAVTAGLPEDAAWVLTKTLGNAWPDNSVFLKDVEGYLTGRESISSEGYPKFTQEMERRWPGIMIKPDAVEGRMQKPKFKDRPKAVARRLLELKP